VERPFQDIRITGLDTNKTHDLPSQDGTHRLYLTLSGVPPATWRDIFARERRTARSSIWRDATIDGMFIVITCTPEELEKYHLEFLKEDVKNTNEKFRLSIVEQEELSARFRQSEEARKKRLEEVRDRLKFD
jgi:ribonuclease D